MSHVQTTRDSAITRITRYWVRGFPTILFAMFLIWLVSLPLWIPVGFAIAWQEWLRANNLHYVAAFVLAAIQLIYLPTALGWLACEIMPKIFDGSGPASRKNRRFGEPPNAADSR